jgi:hypothetical protein
MIELQLTKIRPQTRLLLRLSKPRCGKRLDIYGGYSEAGWDSPQGDTRLGLTTLKNNIVAVPRAKQER